MKKMVLLLIVMYLSFFTFKTPVSANNPSFVYFYFETLGNELNQLTEYEILTYDVSETGNLMLYQRYLKTYNVPLSKQTWPILFVGDVFFTLDEIPEAIREGLIDTASQKPLRELQAADQLLIYFYSPTCKFCAEIGPEIENLTTEGIYIIKYGIPEQTALMNSYSTVYQVPKAKQSVPLVFAGGKYFSDLESIKTGIQSEKLIEAAMQPLNTVDYTPVDTSRYDGLWGLGLILLAGLIDGINPCAIAMLIIFISLIAGFSKRKSLVISVSISYILGLFITYFLLGAVFLEFMDYLSPYISGLSLFIYGFIVLISLFFFGFNFYDFYVSRREQYGKIKNQLPKRMQKFNKKLIKTFTTGLENRKLPYVYLSTFLLGVIISLTEFLCTGQVYLPTLLIIVHSENQVSGMLKLLIYNLMFILPLIFISVLAIKTQSVMATSDKVRKNLPWIKLITGLMFLTFAIYYLIKIFEVI